MLLGYADDCPPAPYVSTDYARDCILDMLFEVLFVRGGFLVLTMLGVMLGELSGGYSSF